MNKSQLVEVLAERLGDRKIAAEAVDGVLATIVDTVRSGQSVSLAGFGVFESRARAARRARNPRTGESVDVPATTVPAFRPGTGFKSAVSGDGAEPAKRVRAAATATAEVSEPAPAAAEPELVATEPVKGVKAEKAAKAAKSKKDSKDVKEPRAKDPKPKKKAKGKK